MWEVIIGSFSTIADGIISNFGVIIGGLLAIISGIASNWYQIKHARKMKMEEAIAEKKITVNGEAYAKMKKIQSLLSTSNLKDTHKYIISQEEWLMNNRLYLPGKYPDKWLFIRNNITNNIESSKLSKIAEEAIDEIYNETGHRRLKPE